MQQLLGARPEQLEDERIVAVLGRAVPVHLTDAVAGERLVQPRLVRQLRVRGRQRLKFDRHLLARPVVCAQVDLAEGAAADLAAQLVGGYVVRVRFGLCHLWPSASNVAS